MMNDVYFGELLRRKDLEMGEESFASITPDFDSIRRTDEEGKEY
jgi:hypothetical protein